MAVAIRPLLVFSHSWALLGTECVNVDVSGSEREANVRVQRDKNDWVLNKEE